MKDGWQNVLNSQETDAWGENIKAKFRKKEILNFCKANHYKAPVKCTKDILNNALSSKEKKKNQYW